MSTSAVSSSSADLQLQQYFHTRQTDLHQLGKALGTGDLAGAEAAFQAIAKLGQSGPFPGGEPFSNPQREQDFTAIGQALQSGNLTAAQQAFSNLKATFQNDNGGQAAPVANPILTAAPSSVGPEIIINLSNNNGVNPTPEEITLNLNPTAGGGEQVSLSIGPQGSTNPQQFQFNLPANSNEEIVLNLGGSSSTAGSTPSTTSTSGGLSVSA
ncbi:MAG: hypothetical protein ABSB14_08385 [Candidatus Sulfotelmatobacter sp.]|jgi:hypothetical protein